MHNERKERSNPALVLVILFVAAALLLFCLNFLTGPIIEKNGSAQAFAPLFSVMPDAKDFEVLYDVNDSAASELKDVPELPLDGVFSTVTGAFRIQDGGAQYYGFAARSYGYSNEVMTVYYILDANGAIVRMQADELIFYAEYFSDYTLDESQYKAGFAGLTGDTFTGEQALISGATASSNAVAAATKDTFAAYQIIQANGGENG